MSQIVPAVLAYQNKEFNSYIEKLTEFGSEWVHIDFIDGIFLPVKKTIMPCDIDSFVFSRLDAKLEAHLMVENPEEYFMSLFQLGFKRVVVHWELTFSEDFVYMAEQYGFDIGVAINPDVSLEDIQNIKNYSYLLFMSVYPGRQGGEFQPDVLDKIRRYKEANPDKEVNIDGGVNISNIDEVINTGVDKIVVGSGIWKSDNPQKSYLDLVRALH